MNNKMVKNVKKSSFKLLMMGRGRRMERKCAHADNVTKWTWSCNCNKFMIFLSVIHYNEKCLLSKS